MQKIIAEEHYCYKPRDGSMRSIKIYLRAPYRLSVAEWGCYCHVEDLFDKEIRIHGGSSIQALCLAISFLKSQLRAYEEKGGFFYYPDDTCVPLESVYLFGDYLPPEGATDPRRSERD